MVCLLERAVPKATQHNKPVRKHMRHLMKGANAFVRLKLLGSNAGSLSWAFVCDFCKSPCGGLFHATLALIGGIGVRSRRVSTHDYGDRHITAANYVDTG